ncbi:hypothetical protein BC629DRAFT_1726530 [Irpex lacteus]|nr:hypothetical protein BC629DRAFT_1726530 [Irpex lacteus]
MAAASTSTGDERQAAAVEYDVELDTSHDERKRLQSLLMASSRGAWLQEQGRGPGQASVSSRPAQLGQKTASRQAVSKGSHKEQQPQHAAEAPKQFPVVLEGGIDHLGRPLLIWHLGIPSRLGGHRDIHHDKYGHDLESRQQHNAFDKRANILASGSQLADSYDFVIVGGGTAGLVLAARLSEDSNHTVLCIEAGDSGDDVKDSINTPANAYYQSLLGSAYDWAFTTTAQSGANGRTITWPRGKVLGGSSAINGMYMVRPTKTEIDAWAALVPGGSDKWNWDSLFAGMQTSETFTPPTDAVRKAGNVQFNTVSRGTSGPVHVTYPGYVPGIVGDWTDSLANIGIPLNTDAYGGDDSGGFVATSAINPSNWTRSYARSAYIDPSRLAPTSPSSPETPNGNKNATAVEFASSSTAARKQVKVNKEVILAGGAVGSPHVLMHSGVGPKDVLNSANVTVQIELPGVGQHLQDHISTQVSFKTNAVTAAQIHSSNDLPDGVSQAAFMSYINSATAYANLSDLVGLDSYQAFHDNVVAAVDSSASTLLPSQDPTVIAGYKTIYNATASFLTQQIGQVEILLSLTGTPQGAQTVAIQAALQHPLSQGHIWITSSDPFEAPSIDPGYMSHSADRTILREGLKLARKLGSTAPSPPPTTPSSKSRPARPSNPTTTGTNGSPTPTAPSSTPRARGVVDSDLKVYGLANVRVVDASVFTIQLSAHLMAPIYGLAERAAGMIRNEWNVLDVQQPTTNSTNTTSSAPSANTTSANNDNSDSGKSAAGRTMGVSIGAMALGAVVFSALL